MKGLHDMNMDDLSLYVDYSTCIAMGQNSQFFQALVPSWTNATKKYYSIEGNNIIQHSPDSTYSLLRTIHEVNYADIKNAIGKMANSNSESVLLTDGEYYQPNIAQGNINNPYMADALKTWLKKGHDIFILSEPYQEPNNGKIYNKKRFYIIFTDTRFRGNIYSRIIQTVDFSRFPSVETFHLSADHPNLFSTNGTTTVPNESLNATVTPGQGAFEVQDWPIDWEKGIEPLIVNAIDPNTGATLPDGQAFTSGLKLDRNAFGGYRITDVVVRPYNINVEYTNFYDALENKTRPEKSINPALCENFMKVDEKEFQRHGVINLHFDTQMYNPGCLNGTPFNYTKVDICVSKVEPLFAQHKDMFTFESIDMPGQNNVSVAASVEQCLTDPTIKDMISNCPIYTIYIKSNER